LEGFYYKPRVDKEVLRQYSEGIICLSACILGEVPNHILRGHPEKALEAAIEYRDIFGKDDYYLELMDHGLEDERKAMAGIIEISKKTGIPLVATNDCHFLRREDHKAHDILLCVGTNKSVNDEARKMRYPETVYYRSPQEMRDLFSHTPQALKNTLAIAEKINIKIENDKFILPQFPIPPEFQSDVQFLRHMCFEGLKKHYPNASKEHVDRLEYELSVIEKMGFASYFLIVWDFIKYAKDNDIRVGPGRGSGAGAIVAYVLGITDICPLKYGLLFERFLNPDRRSMPDLDIDFADTGRDKVIEYVIDKYGKEKCAQIITFGSMQARQAIKDVARTMDFTPADSNKIAKLIPFGTSIAKAKEISPDFAALIKSEPKIAKLVAFAQKLEGLKRHTGVHAAGMIIANEDIRNYSPLAKTSKDITTTQYDGVVLPNLGLLKVDFLGLKMLTVIDDCIKLIREKNKDFDINNVPLDDANTYKLLAKARTDGVFQLESDGMKEAEKRLKPESIDDITALIALFRPSTMAHIDDFIARKHKKKKIAYVHPLQEPILKDTYGVGLYQEQIMRMSIDLAGYTPGEADSLRKAMSKKNKDVLVKEREKFKDGAQKKGIPAKTADKIYDDIESFGGYGFNKSHSAAYALVAYQSAYLKANYPNEYMVSLLNSEIFRSAIKDNEESRLSRYLDDAKDFGMQILPPDVQYSGSVFNLEDGNIRYPLLAIKGVGRSIVESIEKVRAEGGTFKDWNDFLQRIDLKSANKTAFEGLAKAGALDCFGDDNLSLRASLLGEGNMEFYIDGAAKIKAQKEDAQGLLFGADDGFENAITLTKAHALQQKKALEYEKEVLGFYLSGHPLEPLKNELSKYCDYRLNELPNPEDKNFGKKGYKNAPLLRLAGMIIGIDKRVSKKGDEYARFKLEDLYGSVEAILFPTKYQSLKNYLAENSVVIIKGRLSGDEDKKEIFVEEISSLEHAQTYFTAAVPKIEIKLAMDKYNEVLEAELKKIFAANPGDAKIHLYFSDPKDGDFSVETEFLSSPTEDFIAKVNKVVGNECASIEYER
jgi:DNA polymerase-3 subunit alpha